MSKKIYSSPEITVTKIQLQSMLMDLSNGTVTFGNDEGEDVGGAAVKSSGYNVWDDAW